ncbi:MAG: PqqD family protein [Salinivirgaceae bacterium]|nr:PqqD family protein [Salinivirgaceae bacterium]
MKLKKNIAVSKTGFLFDPNTGASFNLNKTGQFILKMLEEHKDEKEIMNEVLEKYDVEANVYQRYMDDFTMMLKQFGIVEQEEN